MGIIGNNLRKGRNTLRAINKAMRKSDSKGDVFDLDIYRDEAEENLRRARRKR